MARHYTDKNGKIRTESSMSRGASGELSSDLLSCCLLRGAERDTSYNNYHPLVMFLHTSGRWSGGKWMSPHYFLIRTTLLHPSHCSRSRPAGDRGNARGRGGALCGNNAAGAGPRGALWRCQHCHQVSSRMQQQITWPGVSDRLPPPGDTQMMEICSPIVLCSLM